MAYSDLGATRHIRTDTTPYVRRTDMGIADVTYNRLGREEE
jgi:hypothetical protein